MSVYLRRSAGEIGFLESGLSRSLKVVKFCDISGLGEVCSLLSAIIVS